MRRVCLPDRCQRAARNPSTACPPRLLCCHRANLLVWISRVRLGRSPRCSWLEGANSPRGLWSVDAVVLHPGLKKTALEKCVSVFRQRPTRGLLLVYFYSAIKWGEWVCGIV